MNNPKLATGGRFKGVRYFNGGLFAEIDPIELTRFELELLGGEHGTATKDWSESSTLQYSERFSSTVWRRRSDTLLGRILP